VAKPSTLPVVRMTAFATRREKFMIGFLKEENANPTINFSAKGVIDTLL